MPYTMKKVRGKSCYRVSNRKTHRVYSKCSTKSNAKKQLALLRAIEQNPKFVLRSRSSRKRSVKKSVKKGGKRGKKKTHHRRPRRGGKVIPPLEGEGLGDESMMMRTNEPLQLHGVPTTPISEEGITPTSSVHELTLESPTSELISINESMTQIPTYGMNEMNGRMNMEEEEEKGEEDEGQGQMQTPSLPVERRLFMDEE